MVNRIVEGKDAAKPEKPVDLTLKKVSYQHQFVINAMLKAITLCPMDDELKMILRMRIWGRNPLIFAPMSVLDIAALIQCRVADVEKWENDALYNVTEFLKKTDIPAIGERFNQDNRIKDLLDPPKRIIV